MSHVEVIRLNVVPGALYRCRLALASGGHGRRLLYRIVGVAQHYPTMQEVAVYEGVDGSDAGRLFSCTLADLAIKFEPVTEATA